jgi:hypothetical protein
MIKKIEIGRVDRQGPLLIAEKKDKAGNVIKTRIYQRKELSSIDSFKEKIKTSMKYSLEDFFFKHKIDRLAKLLNVKKISLYGNRFYHNERHEKENEFKSLLQNAKSELSLGMHTKENEQKVIKELEDMGFSDVEISVNSEEYKDEDFFDDLSFLGKKWGGNITSIIRKQVERKGQFQQESYVNRITLTLKNSRNLEEKPEWILGNDYDNIAIFKKDMDARSGDNQLGNLQKFQKKFDEFFKKIEDAKPTDGEMNNWLLEFEAKNASNINGQGQGRRPTDKPYETSTTVIKAINLVFTDSAYGSVEEINEAKELLQNRYTKIDLPRHIEMKLWPEKSVDNQKVITMMLEESQKPIEIHHETQRMISQNVIQTLLSDDDM